ncbi:hypothetical protein O0Z71_05265 [Ligilactobacillus saerimneri]|uniref:hypothetical protein n=1 Tax=Ligilactobacillus saerimneri TaxID=228229 RepID=UPI0022A6C7B6|nr:hypothetical protein [Ligilactobacillus saerimneri]MCZ0891848.1 hypothetical protein [Ligilactobacillus saerimneri]
MELMNLKQVRDLLGFKSYKPIHRLIEDGLPVVMIGKRKYIKKETLQSFIKNQTQHN